MRIHDGLILAACAGLCAPALRADVLQEFNVSGSIVTYRSSDLCSNDLNGCTTGSLSGALTVDTTKGTIVSSDLSAMNNGMDYSFGQATSQGVLNVQLCYHVNGGCSYDTYFATYSTADGTASLDLTLTH